MADRKELKSAKRGPPKKENCADDVCRVCETNLWVKYGSSTAKSFVNLFKPSLSPFSLIRDFRKQNTCGNVCKISVNHPCYRQIGSKFTNHSPPSMT